MKTALLLTLFLFTFCNTTRAQHLTEADYEKKETYIITRDKVALYTVIYQPKNKSKKYPVLLTRTPYGCAPYGSEMPEEIMYNELLVREGYIFVCQDIRGRAMSDGEDMINMKPAFSLKDRTRTDEVTDAYDTIDWLVKNIAGNNGKLGLYGHSYRGWTALMGALCHHKALKAVQTGSPCIDIYFEDFSRYGLFALAYTPIIDWFGTPKIRREEGPWWERRKEYFSSFESPVNKLDKDNYDFFLRVGALKNFTTLLSEKNYFLKYLKDHPDYDSARQERNAIPYLKNINCPILIVGGWNDEQNMYGVVKSFEAVSANNKAVTKYIVGPWTHGDYRHSDGAFYVGDIFYGNDINDDYKKREFNFFQAYLNNGVSDTLSNISLYNTGTKQWTYSDKMPEGKHNTFYLQPGELLSQNPPSSGDRNFFEYISDPAKPVPYVEDDNFNLFIAKNSMTADQRFASKRPDVLTFATPVLQQDICIGGKLTAALKFSTSLEDADLIVKLIDVLPMDRKPEPTDKPGVKMNGYQQLIRCGYIRGRYRNSFSKPLPFKPGEVTDVHVDLLNICHTFKKGHKVMIQIQSSYFPLFDRNPQRYITNIFEANDSDFVKANHRIYSGSKILFSEY
jgi:putative CocE/NonD family hydrolase